MSIRKAIFIEDELVTTAREFTGITNTRALVHEALKALIARESARRLALLGGSEPGLRNPPPRRQDTSISE